MLSTKIQLTLLIVVLHTFQTDAASIKKTIDDTPSKNQITTEASKILNKKSPPAIIAIEIVDEPHKNQTGKNSKRTIESSLGYGYQGPLNSYDQHNNHGKKFVIYKYSQHDIPATVPNYNLVNSYNKPHSSYTDIQKSIGYNLGTITTHVNNKALIENKIPRPVYAEPKTQYYNPGNTFYTTFDQEGLGGISQQIPYQEQGHSGIVPVILLRVYSHQINSPNTPLYTNLPQAHPYADLNNVNLQAYLQNYLQQYLQTQQVVYQPTYQQQTYDQSYQTPEQYPTNLPTHENYPTKQHTRVVFHSDNGHIPVAKSHKTSTSSSNKHISYPMYIPPQHSQTNVEIPQQNVQYTYNMEVDNDDQRYMYVYPEDMYQNVYYQENNGYYEPEGNYENNANNEPQENTEQPYNYHAHPVQQTVKEKRSKPSLSQIKSTTTRKGENSSRKTTS